MRGAWPAVLGLFLVAVLQNVDVILVKRQIGGDEAGAYAAAAVAAKAVVWVAIGVGLYLLPAAVRRAVEGGDPRPILLRALAVVSLVALPMLLAYAVAPELVLRLAFGEETVVASGALFTLGLAMTLLAAGYLCVQYMLALRPRDVPVRARRGGGRRDRAAVGRRPEHDRGLRGRGPRPAGGGRPVGARARARAPPARGRGLSDADAAWRPPRASRAG